MSEDLTEQLIRAITDGGKDGFDSVNYTEVKAGEVIGFEYKAEKPGLPNTNLYDRFPLIGVTEVKRNRRDGRVLITGINIHYLERKFDKGRTILSIKTNIKTYGRALYRKMIHSYRLARMNSNIYRLSGSQLDPMLFGSEATWTQV